MREALLLSSLLSQRIRSAISSRAYAFTLHAVRQAEERHITPGEVEEAILAEEAEIIEDYPEDPRGPSCLILGWTAVGRPLHVQLSYPPLVWVVTVYEPTPDKWIDHRTRRG
jgi:hypothetical protein